MSRTWGRCILKCVHSCIKRYFTRSVLSYAIPRHDHLLLHKCSCHTWRKIGWKMHSLCDRILTLFPQHPHCDFMLFVFDAIQYWLGDSNRRWQHTLCHCILVGESILIVCESILTACNWILTGRMRRRVWAGRQWASRRDSRRLWLHTFHRRSLAYLSCVVVQWVNFSIFWLRIVWKCWPDPGNSWHRNSSYFAVEGGGKTGSLLSRKQKWEFNPENWETQAQHKKRIKGFLFGQRNKFALAANI